MSKVITLGEHKWELPPMPGTADEVLFSKEIKRNQYWCRLTDFPKYFYAWDSETILFSEHTLYDELGAAISLNRSDSKRLLELRDQELRRRRLGVWFMNDGEPTYLTGGHYFMLQWGQLMGSVNSRTNEPYAEYREFQAHTSYFLLKCKQDKDCLGAYLLKPKKTGITQLLALDILDESTRLRGKWFGMMSKTLVPDCRDVNFQMYKHGLENLPNIMKPSIANENLTMIFYGNPVNNKNNSRKKRAQAAGNLKWLNTRVSALPTKANGFDGGFPFRGWLDELPKYEDPYPEDVIPPTSAAMKMQTTITGKLWASSYTPENDKKNKEQAEKFYYESKLRTRDDVSNRTKSEMYAYFINVLDSALGSHDVYGKADRRKTQIWISSQAEKLKNDKAALQSFHRQNPTCEEDAWRSGGAGGSTFDNIRLAARKFKIEEDLRVGRLPYRECNLEWTGPDKKLVVVVPITFDEKKAGKEGLFRLYCERWWPVESLNEPVVADLRDEEGRLRPSDNCRFIAGLDPTNFAAGRLIAQGSKNSLWVFSLPDSNVNALARANVTERHVLEYLYRHDRPTDTYDDIKKVIHLFGCPIAIEGNMGWAVSMLIAEGLQNFVLVRDRKTKAIVPYSHAEHQSMITTSKNRISGDIQELVRLTTEYIALPRHGDEYDKLESIDSEVLLSDLMRFDAENTKEYDHSIGFMLTIQAMYNYMAYMTHMRKIKAMNNPEGLAAMATNFMNDY